MEWNPLELFFQGFLGWDIWTTLIFCFGSQLLLWIPVIIVGKLSGYSKGMWFNSDKSEQSQTVKDRGYFVKIGLVVIAIAFVVAIIIHGE